MSEVAAVVSRVPWRVIARPIIWNATLVGQHLAHAGWMAAR
jgi:hypothetical protein